MGAQGLAAAAGSEGLLITARRLVEGLYAGRHRSIERGGASDFHDHRAYTPGDPLQRIDWRLAARSDRLHVRRYRQESQLTVLIALDESASMGFASMAGASALRPTKHRRALELAAAVATLAARQGERVGLVASGDTRWIPPGAGWPRLHEVVAALERSRAAGRDGLARALTDAAALHARAPLIVAIGDALEEPGPLLDAAARLHFAPGARAGRSLDVIHIVTDDELDIAGADAGRFVDPETDASTRAGEGVAPAYARAVRAHLDDVHDRLAAMGCRHALHRTSAPPVDALREVYGV